jgi:hypothetical protein
MTVTLQHKNFVEGTVTVYNASGILMPDSLYKVNTTYGQIRGSNSGSLPAGKYTISYQYYPVYQSKYIRGTPYTTDSKDADVFDGVTLVFNNPWSVAVDTTSKWITNKSKYRFAMSPVEIYNGDKIFIAGYTKPCDYELQFDTTKILDTSYADPNLGSDAIPTNFRVYNRTENKFVKFTYNYSTIKTVPLGRLVPSEELYIYEKNPRGTYSYTWLLGFSSNDQKAIPYDKNDTLRIFTTKPFEQGDTLTFSTTKTAVDLKNVTQNDLNKIRVVPNPYVAASTLESPLPPGVTSGRLRRIDFIHLPSQARIQIYTSRGDHVITLYQDGNIEDGHVSWNLKSSENLDVAFGVYFYIVESSIGTKTGKFAIIK